jgi:hypothetical protein
MAEALVMAEVLGSDPPTVTPHTLQRPGPAAKEAAGAEESRDIGPITNERGRTPPRESGVRPRPRPVFELYPYR